MNFITLLYPIFIIFLPPIASKIAVKRSWKYQKSGWHRLTIGLWFISLFPVGISVSSEIVAGMQQHNNTGQNSNIYLGDLYLNSRVTQAHLHGLPGFEGVDISNGCDSPLISPINGTVTYAGLDGYNHVDSRGVVWPQATMLTITGDNEQVTLLHGQYSAAIGQHVNVGDLIGTEASIGWSTGCHSHVIMRKNGQLVNFLDYKHQNNELAILITWYDPKLGGINCDSDCSMLADGSATANAIYYGNAPVSTAACLREWIGRTVTIDGLGTFLCRDTGGGIVTKYNEIHQRTVIHLDVMAASEIPCNYCIYENWRLE